MQIDIERTAEDFGKKITRKYLSFLKKRNVTAPDYIQALKEGAFGYLKDNMITIAGVEYNVSYILGASKTDIYDLIRVNQIYGIEPEEGTIFAITLGDDYLFFKPNDAAVYFFCRDTEEDIKVSSDYKTFAESI